MKKRTLWICAVVVLVLVGALLVWKLWPGAEVEPTASPEAAPPKDQAAVTFEDEHSATAVQQVTVGENHAAAITVSFSYKLQGDRRVITDIGSAEAENLSEWQYVERAATVSEDKIVFSEDGSKASVPVTYQASIGDGNASYDAIVVIDLTAD